MSLLLALVGGSAPQTLTDSCDETISSTSQEFSLLSSSITDNEFVSITDTYSGNVVSSISAPDIINTNTDNSATISVGATTSETINAIDAVSVNVSGESGVMENVTLADIISAFATMSSGSVDNNNATTNEVALLTSNITHVDLNNIGSVENITVQSTRSLVDVNSVIDVIGSTLIAISYNNDSIGVGDSIIANVIYSGICGDTNPVNESLGTSAILSTGISDVMSIGDSRIGVDATQTTVADSVLVATQESVTASIYGTIQNDGVVMTTTVIGNNSISYSLSDIINVADTQNSSISYVSSANDNIIINDNDICRSILNTSHIDIINVVESSFPITSVVISDTVGNVDICSGVAHITTNSTEYIAVTDNCIGSIIRYGKATIERKIDTTMLTQFHGGTVTAYIRASMDHLSSIDGITPIIKISKCGTPFVESVRTITGLGDGVYSVTLTAQDTDTIGELMILLSDPLSDNSLIIASVISPIINTPTVNEFVDSIWQADISSYTNKNTFGGYISKTLLSVPKFLGLK